MKYRPDPIAFTKSMAKNLAKSAQITLHHPEVPQYLRDVIEHDVLNPIHRLQHVFTFDGFLDKLFLGEDIPNQLNTEYHRVRKLEEAVRNYSFTSRINVQDTVLDAVRQFFNYDLYDGKAIAADLDNKLEIVANQPLVQFMVYNLLKNTIHYAPDSEKVDLSTRAEGNKVVITVADYGSTPLSPEFEIKRKKTGGKGSGLAMNATKEIMEKVHYGKLTHDYTLPDKKIGTAFSLEFPLPQSKYKHTLEFLSRTG